MKRPATLFTAKTGRLPIGLSAMYYPSISVCAIHGIKNTYRDVLSTGCAPIFLLKFNLLCLEVSSKRAPLVALGQRSTRKTYAK
jgi:hypothetical protein